MCRINNLEQLKELSKDGLDCFIQLNAGIRSSKHIWFDEEAKHFEIINEIDESEQCLNEKEIMNVEHTNIGIALELGALYTY